VATAHSPSGEFAVDPKTSANRPQADAFGRCAEATESAEVTDPCIREPGKTFC